MQYVRMTVRRVLTSHVMIETLNRRPAPAPTPTGSTILGITKLSSLSTIYQDEKLVYAHTGCSIMILSDVCFSRLSDKLTTFAKTFSYGSNDKNNASG